MYFDIFPQTAFYSLQKNFCGRNFKILFYFDTSHKVIFNMLITDLKHKLNNYQR